MTYEGRSTVGDRISVGLQGNTNRLGKPKTEEECEAISQALTGRTLSEEHREAIGRATRERLADPDYYESFCRNMQRGKEIPEYREERSAALRKRWEDPEFREMMRKANNYGSPERSKHISEALSAYYKIPGVREALSEYWKKRWAEDEGYQKAQSKAKNRRPNSSEILLDYFFQDFFPGEWKFVGNGEVVMGGKCPDFININGRKKVIELFGGHWHDPCEEVVRAVHFEKYGFEMLVVWWTELWEARKYSI